MSTHKWPWPENSWPTVEQLWQGLNEASPEDRVFLLERVITVAQAGQKCLLGNHDTEIRALRKERDDARTVLPDREHIAQLNREEVNSLRDWLARPTGGRRLGRVTFEAVEGGGLLVRTRPYRILDNIVIQSLGISPGPNAFGYSIELVDPEPDDRVCRVCGCTSERACVTNGVPCHWVADTLCSACEAKALREGAS